MDDSPAAEGLQPEHVPPGADPDTGQIPKRPCPCPAFTAGLPCPCQAPVPGRPLPDLLAIRLADVPNSWPPYDDEVSARAPRRLEVAFPDTTSPGGQADARAEARASGEDGSSAEDGGSAEDGSGEPGRDRTTATGHGADDGGPERESDKADAERWPSQFAQVLAETLAGARPASQMTPWTTERARAHIRRLGPLLAAAQRPRVHRVVTSRPVEDVVEVAVIVGFGSRTHALAARLERAGPQPATRHRPARQARWLCTAVESA